ncbi:MAG: hypothetical protein DRO40_10265 [Thermoprotei archaeon]|nr:MAG: hypothetical protein DRO40_10265 [Thermoprotei archaeon]
MKVKVESTQRVKVRLDKGIYLFVKCYSEYIGRSIEETVCELLRMFRFLSGEDEGLSLLEKISSSKDFYIPVLGKPVVIEVKLCDNDLEYLNKVSKITGVNLQDALKICLATLAKILQKCFPYIKCKLKGYGYARFRLPDFKEVISKRRAK